MGGKVALTAPQACPASPVAPADGTGVAPEDGTGVGPEDRTGALCRRQIVFSQFLQETEKAKNPIKRACPVKCVTYFTGVNPVGQEEYQNITDVPHSTEELTKSES